MDSILFNTETWNGASTYLKWPEGLIPLVVAISNPLKRPPTPGTQLNGNWQDSKVFFSRIRISIKHFAKKWVDAKIDEIERNHKCSASEENLRKLQIYALLGEDYSSREIESEVKFSKTAFEKAHIELVDTWKYLTERDNELAWAELLPKEIQRSFFQASTRNQLPDEDKNSKAILDFLNEKEGMSFNNIRRSFQRKFPNDFTHYDPNLNRMIYEVSVEAHQSLERSVQFLLSHPAVKTYLEKTGNPIATIREAEFYFTSKGPWTLPLCHYVPAFNGAAPSLVEQLSPGEQELFDQFAFVQGEVPPFSIVQKLLTWTTTYAEELGRLRKHRADTQAKRQYRRGRPVKSRLIWQVDLPAHF